jgi:hypothetical protein
MARIKLETIYPFLQNLDKSRSAVFTLNTSVDVDIQVYSMVSQKDIIHAITSVYTKLVELGYITALPATEPTVNEMYEHIHTNPTTDYRFILMNNIHSPEVARVTPEPVVADISAPDLTDLSEEDDVDSFIESPLDAMESSLDSIANDLSMSSNDDEDVSVDETSDSLEDLVIS